MIYTLDKAAKVAGGQVVGPAGSALIECWAYDSRLPFRRQRACFLALAGPTRSGSSYAHELYEQGVRLFCVSENDELQLPEQATLWRVEHVLDAIQQVAAHRRSKFSGEVVGITGSNGKTIVKEWLYTLLGGAENNIYRSPRSFNSQLGVALSVLGIPAFAKTAIIEAGISKGGEMAALARMIAPTIGIFTNLGDAHDAGFDDQHHKLREKHQLFQTCRVVVRQAADDELPPRIQWTTSPNPSGAGVQVSFEAGRLVTKGEVALDLPLPYSSDAQRENLVNAVLAASYLGVEAAKLEQAISRLPAPQMRMAVSRGRRGLKLIDDSYSSDASGLHAALDFFALRHQPPATGAAILGSLTLDDELAAQLMSAGISKLVLVGGRVTLGPIEGLEVTQVDSVADALAAAEVMVPDGATVLIKGPRALGLEVLATQLRQRAHEVRLEIDLAALAHNIAAFRERLAGRTKICVMVKAQAYGSGGAEIAQFFEQRGVDYLAVAYIDEGIELRKAGSTLPIIVGNVIAEQQALLLEYQLEPEVTTLALLQSYADTRLPLHLKLDTGMHRLGFDVTGSDKAEFEALLEELASGRYKVKSIFSHLSASDDPAADEFSRKQHEKLKHAAARIETVLGYQPMLHLLNSAGAWRLPALQEDMVRLGIGIYGIGLETIAPGVLEPAHRLVAQLIQIKYVGAGEVVGYNLGGKAPVDRRIGVVNIGYADGLRRQAGNGRYSFHLAGNYAPTVGTVCMDFCMIDLRDCPLAQVGDEVEIFGQRQGVWVLAKAYDTIAYEVFTGIGQRVRRLYYS